ncbi:hypothetical protein Leryth_025578 [Lithospermum erythrorhizon]|uniref:Uncharacterized protein n=1 Tax=Lithospermum erythrorhizon TaxID=34254 RepID=A0AAV3NNX2_LITER|nr:hypothetical protein Leryth_025578 [Lithospermum erythrorhizon]
MEDTRNISSSHVSSSSDSSKTEELHLLEHAPPFWRSPGKKRLSKQLSMCETPRDIAWEKRRRQMFQQERKNRSKNLTDEDLNELKGCIELGFGFNEEEGQTLCHTLPALDLYFAVNRQYSISSNSPSTPSSQGSLVDSTSPKCHIRDRSASFASFGNLGTESTNTNSWMICNPGDDPQEVKTKLRHWAQAVACSVLQSY